METPPPAPPDAPAPTVAISEGDAIVVPALQGKSVRDAAAELARLGLTPALVGTGIAVEESPEAGATVRRGSRVTVRFGQPADAEKSAPRKSRTSAKAAVAAAHGRPKPNAKSAASSQGQR